MIRQEYLTELVNTRVRDVSSSCLLTSSRVWLEVEDLMSRQVATVGTGENVLSAAKLMASDHISSLVVLDDGQVKGIITETDFLKKVIARGLEPANVRVTDVMSTPVVSVSPKMSVFEAGEVAERSCVKRLPVVDKGRLVGIVTRTDLVRVLTSYGMWREISEIMSTNIAVIPKDAPAAEAATIMSRRNISGIVVTGPEGVAGVLTERDFLRRVVAAGKNALSVRVEQVMSHPVVAVPPYYSVFSCSRIMDKMHIRRLVVEDNKRICGVVTQTDIFRAIEQRLREEEENNYRLLEEAQACIYTLDLEGRITYVNPAFMKLLGVADGAQLLGRHFLPEQFWFNPQDKNRFLKDLKKGAVEVRELTLRALSSRRIDVTLFSSFTRNIHGTISGSQGVLHNITDKKELVALKDAETALRASEERYHRIADAVTDYIFTVRFENGRPVETIHGQASFPVTGYTPEELAMEPGLWFNMVHPDDWEQVREQTSACISGRQLRPIEHRIIRKDGAVRWVRRTLVRNCDSAGRIVTYDGLLQDITELKIAEQIQVQLLADLEQAGRELAEFAYIASHDLKAPLRGISALADWLSKDYADKLDETGKQQLKLLLGRVRRMYDLIDGVLQYARLARTKEKKANVDLNEVLAQVLARLEPPANIEIAAVKTLPAVCCGDNGIRQVFYCLLDNAINYMDKEQGKVTIDWSEERGCWKFAVSDNGPGIEQQHHERIFKMFQMLAPRDKTEHLGIGLTISRKIIEQHGGRIWVESTPGGGSTFYFTLPKAHKHPPKIPLPAAISQMN